MANSCSLTQQSFSILPLTPEEFLIGFAQISLFPAWIGRKPGSTRSSSRLRECFRVNRFLIHLSDFLWYSTHHQLSKYTRSAPAWVSFEWLSLFSAFGLKQEDLEKLYKMWLATVPSGGDSSVSAFLQWMKESNATGEELGPGKRLEYSERTGNRTSEKISSDFTGFWLEVFVTLKCLRH